MENLEHLDIDQIISLLQKRKGEKHGFIAYFSNKTGLSKDNLYKWAQGKAKPSYLDAYKMKFELEKLESNPTGADEKHLSSGPTWEEYVSSLKGEIAFLRQITHSSLGAIVHSVKAIEARQQAKIQVDAELHGEGDSELEKINSISLRILEVDQKKSIYDGIQGKG